MREQLQTNLDEGSQDSENYNINNSNIMAPSQVQTRKPTNRRITFSENVETVTTIDERLNEFLSRINVSNAAKNSILNADFTYEDFVYEMEKEDLRRLGLK